MNTAYPNEIFLTSTMHMGSDRLPVFHRKVYDSIPEESFCYTQKYIKAPQWQPIETAPRDGTEILVYFSGIGVRQVSWCDRDGDPKSEYAHWHVGDNKNTHYPLRGYCDGDDTHWMPLPSVEGLE